MPLHSADSTMANMSHTAAWGGAGVAVFGGLTANEWAAFCGGAAAICGVLVQVYFKRRDDRRKKELHALEIALKQRALDRSRA